MRSDGGRDDVVPPVQIRQCPGASSTHALAPSPPRAARIATTASRCASSIEQAPCVKVLADKCTEKFGKDWNVGLM